MKSRNFGVTPSGGQRVSILMTLAGTLSDIDRDGLGFFGQVFGIEYLSEGYLFLVPCADVSKPSMFVFIWKGTRSNISRYRPRPAGTAGAGSTPASKTANNNPNASIDRLSRPFKCPGAATAVRVSEKPSRKRRKVNYADADGTVEDNSEKPYTNEDRLALATRDVNRYPVFKPKDKDAAFRQRFQVPLVNKESDAFDSSRPAPTLGMRKGATFVVKPLHDPSGEFAIVLYDPTVDDIEQEPQEKKPEEDKPSEQEAEKQKLDEPIVHKSLADILGLKKEVDTRPKVPVVIDPKLAKILRPHQVEGVKVCSEMLYPLS